jgi:hypothetical protein
VKNSPMTQEEMMPGSGPLNENGNEVVQDVVALDPTAEGKLTEWPKEPTIADIKGDLEFARPENSDQRVNVEGWLNLRNATGAESGRKGKTAIPGRSTVQPKLIRKHNEWRYPALSEPFLNDYKMFTINPRTFEDEKAAKQNQLLINWQFDTKMGKVAFIDKMVRKTVDEGTCIVRVGWERRTEKVTVQRMKYNYFPLQDEQMLQILAQATQQYMADPDVFELDVSIPDSLKASVEYGVQNQVAVYAEEAGMESVTEDKIVWNAPSLKVINSENFFNDPSCEGDPMESQYMIHTYESTQSQLKKRRSYKNLDKVNWSANAIKSKLGDMDHKSTTPMADARFNSDKVKVLIYEYWGLFDIWDTGEMVPIVVTFIGDTIIQMEENPFPDRKPPFVIIPYMPIDGSIFGEADASLLQDNQRIKGAVTRGMIDLIGRSANAQTGYAKGFLDPMNRSRLIKGEDFEFNPNADPRQAIQQMTYPEIPQSAMVISQSQDVEAEAMSGVKAFSAGLNGDAYGKVARNTGAVLDAAGQREMSILRRMAEGMRQIGNKMISMNTKFLEKKEVVRVTNETFVEVYRDELNGNFDLICDIASAQVDELKSQDLGMLMQTIGPDMDPGLRGVIMAKIADLKRMPDLAQQIRAYKPQPDPMQVKLQEMQMQLLQAQIDEVKSKTAKNMADAENKSLDTELDATGVNHQREVELMGAQAKGNRDRDVTGALLNAETSPDNIRAAVGYNHLIEKGDEIKAQPKRPMTDFVRPQAAPQQPPLAPLQSAQQQQLPQGLANSV